MKILLLSLVLVVPLVLWYYRQRNTWGMRASQLSKEQAIAHHASKCWETWNLRQVCAFQIFQDRLCVDFSKYHESLSFGLGRPVWNHEMGQDRLIQEYLGKRQAPSMSQIINLLLEIKYGEEDRNEEA